MRITIIAYVLSSGLAALAGILLVSRLSIASPSMANAYELQAIAAAVVGGASLFGGRGTVLGAVAGAVLFTTMSNGAVLLERRSVLGDGGRGPADRACGLSRQPSEAAVVGALTGLSEKSKPERSGSGGPRRRCAQNATL